MLLLKYGRGGGGGRYPAIFIMIFFLKNFSTCQYYSFYSVIVAVLSTHCVCYLAPPLAILYMSMLVAVN